MARTKIASMDAAGVGRNPALRASLRETGEDVLCDGVPVGRIDAFTVRDRGYIGNFPAKDFRGLAKEMATRLAIRVIKAPAIMSPAEPYGMNWTVKMGYAAITWHMHDVGFDDRKPLANQFNVYAPLAAA
ncbi:hypothetical protein ACFPL7_19240 [Dongia soli]|uniref:Uncharacterized protein n=1 Tax=Dongia soli TaxID=600628 RepID=A0ABU5E618_9PROT|nr:hypothetical protein [Dongia soli]MDY0881727.1 hypothetical protein [Dongia soli]